MDARRSTLARCLAAGVAGALSACGGGLLLAAIVTPLNGVWRLDGDNASEGLQINPEQADAQFYASEYAVTASVLNPADWCGAVDDGSGQLVLVGRYDRGRIVLRADGVTDAPVCIDATFTSLVRLEAEPTPTRPARVYLNDRVGLNLPEGVWRDDDATVELKFGPLEAGDPASIDNADPAKPPVPLRACDRSPNVAQPVLEGAMTGFDEATGRGPTIPALTVVGGEERRYTDIEFVSGATIELRDASGRAVRLERRRETSPTTCP